MIEVKKQRTGAYRLVGLVDGVAVAYSERGTFWYGDQGQMLVGRHDHSFSHACKLSGLGEEVMADERKETSREITAELTPSLVLWAMFNPVTLVGLGALGLSLVLWLS